MPAADAWHLGGCGLLAAAHGGEKEKPSVDEVVEYLSMEETDVNMRSEDLRTALHYACCFGGHDHPAITKLLIQHGADVNATDCAGRTPLHYAAGNGRIMQVRCLLAAGADVHARNCYGSTPLHAAAVGSMRESAQLLLAAGAQLDAVNNGGWTPLQYAIRGGEGFCEPAFVAWLLKQGAARTPQPMGGALSHVFPHPCAMSPHAHGMMQG